MDPRDLSSLSPRPPAAQNELVSFWNWGYVTSGIDSRMRAWFKHMAEIGGSAWRLRPYLRGGRYLILAVVMSSLIAAVLEGVGVSFLVPLLSLLLGGEGATPMRPIRWVQTALPDHSPAFYVVLFCLFVLGAIVAKNVVLYGSQILAATLKRRISVNLRDALFRRLHSAELQLFEQRTAGELANVFSTEIGRTLSTIDFLLLLAQRVSIATFYLVALLVISWQLTLITMLLAGLIGFLAAFLYRGMGKRGRQITEVNQRLASCLVESFAGVRLIRATDSQARVIGNFNALSKQEAELEEKVIRINALAVPITETVAVAGAMSIVGFAYLFFVRTHLMLSSYLLGFGFILLRLLPLVNQIYQLQSHLVYLAWGVKEVERWLASPQYPNRPFGALKFDGVRQSIRFEQVSFAYPNGTQALQDLTFEIPAGKTVALVGASGSGKSTVATLLLRLRQPTTGRISLDGKDYWEFSADFWHSSVAVVEQEAFLFCDTLARNIGFGFPEVSDAAIRTAVRQAQLEDVVAGLPEGLETVVGERGMTLSGGQRQRLAIARALVRDPKILILDEATSALDPLSERLVQSALEDATQGRTVLVIAHRLSTIQHADHIVVLDKGRAVEQGTWRDLHAKGGRFTQLVNSSLILKETAAQPITLP